MLRSVDKIKEFQDYCWSFYAPGEMYGHFFEGNLERREMDAACLMVAKDDGFEGDTFDREKARDLVIRARGCSDPKQW